MPAAYDTYDYISYWNGREYEHKSEVFAIQSFLQKIKKIKTSLEVGAGFGRLASSYSFRAKKVILTDPSSKTLKVARDTYKDKRNFKFMHSSVENLPLKIRPGSIDLVIMVRVIHHIKNVDLAFKVINRMLAPNGYFIFEFANKRHIKAIFKKLLKGNLMFYEDTTTTDIRSKKSIEKGTLPFLNYHPERIKNLLSEYGFDVVQERSVSNIRSVFLKKLFSTDILLSIEKILQIPFSYIDFGPSIFILARKRG